MLASHKESNHNVRHFVVLQRTSITVGLLHQSRNHIMIVLGREVSTYAKLRQEATDIRVRTISTLLDDVHVEVTHLFLGNVPLPITVQRQIWK